MDYRIEQGEKNTAKVYITLDKTEWEAAIGEAYNKTKGKYAMQGFRKGHVPKPVLEKAYGKGIFFEDAINYSFPKYYYEVLEKEKELHPVAAPDIEIDRLDDEGIVLIALVPVKPEVKLGKYKGINIEKVEYNVTDADVDAEIENLRERNSRLVTVEGRAAENGDTVIIDYSGSVDGVVFPGGTAEKYKLVLGSGAFIPGFEEQIVGMNAGEERDINVKFPDDYHAEDLKGKDAVFAVKLHEIKKKELPEADDAFIKDATGAESLEAFRKETRAKLEQAAGERAEREIEDKLLKEICDGSEIELSDPLIERELDRIMDDIRARLAHQGMKLEAYLKYIDVTMEQFRNNYREQAERDVKSQLVIDKLIAQENIGCSDEELGERIKQLAEASGQSPEEFKKSFDENRLLYLKDSIIIKNLFDFLKKNNGLA